MGLRDTLAKLMPILGSIIPSIYFNFHYLPFRQAIKLPILFVKPHFRRLKGSVKIEGPVKTGMVLLGNQRTGLYPDSGIMFENHGGECVFRGTIRIGGASAITIGEYGVLDIGDNVISNAALKLVCMHRVTISNRVRFGWDVMVMDSGFHRLKNRDGDFCGKGYAPVSLAHDTWISTRSMVMPGSATSPYTIVAANSMLNKKIEESYVLLGGSPAIIKKRDVYRDLDDDGINYVSNE